jgi:hypothetical protein
MLSKVYNEAYKKLTAATILPPSNLLVISLSIPGEILIYGYYYPITLKIAIPEIYFHRPPSRQNGFIISNIISYLRRSWHYRILYWYSPTDDQRCETILPSIYQKLLVSISFFGLLPAPSSGGAIVVFLGRSVSPLTCRTED